jgi:hypothetical protein
MGWRDLKSWDTQRANGRVDTDGAPADPAAYDYDRAARDALTFAALFDRFIQNLRRYLGYDVQYFAAIEPQRRLAPHVHLAMRGTISRAELRRVLAATYHQVWWPNPSEIWYDGDELPVWDEGIGGYLDSATGEILPTWGQALDATDPVLAALRAARDRRDQADRDIRILLAYARELATPRPYRLADLADATGRSISGIRTAYTTADVDAARRILHDISAAHDADAEPMPASTGPISPARPVPRHRQSTAGQER